MEVPNINENKKISRSIGKMYKLDSVNVSIIKSVGYSIIYLYFVLLYKKIIFAYLFIFILFFFMEQNHFNY